MFVISRWIYFGILIVFVGFFSSIKRELLNHTIDRLLFQLGAKKMPLM